MLVGLSAGILWGLDTVILSIVLAASSLSAPQAILLAPFVSTFLHDLCSSLWMLFYMGIKKQWKKMLQIIKTRSARFIILAALLGGPVGMTGYVLAIQYIGPAYTAIVSSIFPAVGAMFANLFLKEKMKWYQMIGLAISIVCVILLGYSPDLTITNAPLGFFCAFLCVFGWSIEAVICSYGMKNDEVNSEQALQIRQLTSTITYAVILLPLLRGWKFAADILCTPGMGIIAVSAFFGTASYICYYKAIYKIGASKSMALNITYAAWSIVFSFLLLHTLPNLKQVICAIIIMGGSVVAASDLNEFGILLKRKSIS